MAARTSRNTRHVERVSRVQELHNSAPPDVNIEPERVYVILDERSSGTSPLGEAVETFIRREDAEHFIEEVRGDDPELASYPADRGARARRERAGLAA